MLVLNTSRSMKLKIWFVASSLALVLTGCQSQDSYYNQFDNNKKGADSQVNAISTQKPYLDNNHDSSENVPSLTLTPNPDHESTTETSTSTSTLQTDHVTNSDEESSHSNDGWSSDSPMLHGIAIGDSNSKVLNQFGEEADSYALEEQAEAIQVLEYDGFSVGINTKGIVHFIEVFGPQVQSGLSGLQIGNNPEEVLAALGEPDTQSEYLLLYNAIGATLKLDVNPDVNEVVSIKLLAQG